MTLNSKAFGNTLIAGAGPAAFAVAVQAAKGGYSNKLGIANRAGEHSEQLQEYFEINGFEVSSLFAPHLDQSLKGKASIHYFHPSLGEVNDIWETIILCTPSHTYIEVLKEINIKNLKRAKRVVLLSPGIGSASTIVEQLAIDIEVISLSAYYAATKLSAEEPFTAYTKAVKKKVYVGSSYKNCSFAHVLADFIRSIGPEAEILSSAVEAEARSITTYVHPPLFMNPVAMREILREDKSVKSMYKLYPEGPVSQHAIKAMNGLWKELSEVAACLGAKPINLLEFLNDDNYPVHEYTLSRNDICQFPTFSPEKQEYLLYIRYTSILIDPFSVPDENGTYFDFSKVPFAQVKRSRSGKWVLPRVPLEDYHKLKLVTELAFKAGISMPVAHSLLRTFEEETARFSETHHASFQNYIPAGRGGTC
ncbi:opine metallophore biosynthesis dehydrogenase [Metabacillus idriensis]|uniref:opine metallophore biosynthesis dehydrogenase n=1 Tax=Metabacillus idriensis TaxID=324768 RepID=UPI003D2676E1